MWVTREGKGPEDAQRAGQAVRSLAPRLTPGPRLSPQTPRPGGGTTHSRACPDGGRGLNALAQNSMCAQQTRRGSHTSAIKQVIVSCGRKGAAGKQAGWAGR